VAILPSRIQQRGYGAQAGYGIAYDTDTKRLILFGTGGTAKSGDRVVGVNVGIGLFGGQLIRKFERFLGRGRGKVEIVDNAYYYLY